MDMKVSCLVVDDEPTAREIIEGHLAKIENLEVAGSCGTALEAFKIINVQQIDLIFLDINMPDINGLSFAKSINKEIRIIFTTAYREYAVDGFDLKAVDYLLKPISFERFFRSVTTYFDLYHKREVLEHKDNIQPIKEFMFVKADRKMTKINFPEIIFVESLGDYLKIHTERDVVVTRETLGNVEAKLPMTNFIRIHRSFIVSLAHISSYTHEHVRMKANEIPISRSYKASVLKMLENQ